MGDDMQHFSSLPQGAYLSDCCRCKHSIVASGANLWMIPSLLQHVVGIILGRSTEQMFRVTARRIITAMADEHSCWNWAMNGLPYYSVSFSDWRSTAANYAIAIPIFSTQPNPALSRLIKSCLYPLKKS